MPRKEVFEDEVSELRARIVEKDQRIEELKTQAEEIIRSAQDEVGKVRNPDRTGGFRGLLRAAWSVAPYRLVLLAGVILARMLMFIWFENSPFDSGHTGTVNVIFAPLIVFLLIKWSGLEYEQSGLRVVAMKLVVFTAVTTLAVALLFGFASWHLWFGAPCAGDPNQFGAFALLALAALLGASNFTLCLFRHAETSDARVFQVLREWLTGGNQ